MALDLEGCPAVTQRPSTASNCGTFSHPEKFMHAGTERKTKLSSNHKQRGGTKERDGVPMSDVRKAHRITRRRS